MNKFLVIVVGKSYVRPLVIKGLFEKLLGLLQKESLSSGYLYLIYEYYEKGDFYKPFVKLYNGNWVYIDSSYVKEVYYGES